MICTHLKQLYQLCEDNQLRLASSDLIRIVCHQCEETETCPSMLVDEYDARQSRTKDNSTTLSKNLDQSNASK